MSEIIYLSAAELSEAIHAEKFSCVQVMEAYLDRIAEVNPAVNAIVALQDREKLIEIATEYDKEIAAGKSRGWMHGFPIAVKDMTTVKGLPSTFGSPFFADFIPPQDSIMVERMRSSGAIFIGRTNVPEFALGSHTYNPLYGTTSNAYNHALSAGGSSGGASVALALNMVPVADGSDMMGSLRNPSAWNNVYGFRPSAGVVPAFSAASLFNADLPTEGPMARNARDLALLFDVMAGSDRRVPNSVEALPLPEGYNESHIKIGWLGDFNGYLPMDPELLNGLNGSLMNISSLSGVDVEPVDVSDPNLKTVLAAVWDSWVTLRSMAILKLYDDLPLEEKQKLQFKPEFLWEVMTGLDQTVRGINFANSTRSKWLTKLNTLFKKYDFLVLPSTQIFPFPKEQHWPESIGDTKMDTYHRWMEVTIYASLVGLPAATIPVGFKNGLSMGVQIIGPRLHDRRVLSILQRLEPAFAGNRKLK